MKLAIVSDIHANLEALRATLDDIAAQRVDRIVCLGDIVGYNASPEECVALLRDSHPVCVAGNHDRAVTGQITTDGFDAPAVRAIAWTRERLGGDALGFLAGLPLLACVENHLVAVHGALLDTGGCERSRLSNDERRRRSFEALTRHPSGAHVCAFGHTHRLGIFEFREGRAQALVGDEVHLRSDAYYLVNPGAVGQPRRASDGQATYLVLDVSRHLLTVRRVTYDRAASLARTREAKLATRSSLLPDAIRMPLFRAYRKSGLRGIVTRATTLLAPSRSEAGPRGA